MISRIAKIVESERLFLKGLAHVAGGAAIGHLVVIAVSPIITRLYSPSDFGVFGLVVAYIGFFSAIGGLKYELAIVSADSEDEARSLFAVSIFLSLILSFLSGLVFLFLKEYSLFGYGTMEYFFIPLVLAGVGFTSIYSVVRVALIRHQEYAIVGKVSFVKNLVWAGGQVLLGLFNLSATGLVGGEVLSRFSGILTAWRTLRKKMYPDGLKWKVNKETLRKYRRFPLLSWPASFLNALGPLFQVPILTNLYGFEFAGQFMLVSTVFGMFVALIGQSIGEVSHGRLSELKAAGPHAMGRFLRKLVVTLCAANTCLVLIVWLFASRLFPIIFGKSWTLAGELAPWVALYCFISIIVFPVDRMVFVNEWHKTKLFFNTVFLACVIFIPLIASANGLSGLTAISLLGSALALNYLLYVYVIIRRGLLYGTKPVASH